MKTIITLVLIALVAAIGIIGITLYLAPNNLADCPTQPNDQAHCHKADAIVALSGGDTSARTAAAIELFKNDWADTLIFSGAAQDKSGPSNAAVMRQQAIEAGVPDGAIIVDEEAIDTAQNASNTEIILDSKGIHTVIVVTSGYHQRRASLEFEKIVQDAVVLNAPTNDKDWDGWWWLRPRGWWLAGSELVKIVVFKFEGLAL